MKCSTRKQKLKDVKKKIRQGIEGWRRRENEKARGGTELRDTCIQFIKF